MQTATSSPIALIEPPGHGHAADLETCLELVNTVELTDGIPEDHLASADDAISWLAVKGLAHEATVRAQAVADPDAWFDRLSAARAALREAWDAQVQGRPPDAHALTTLNALLALAPRPELHASSTGLTVAHHHSSTDPTGEALALIAQPLVEAIAAGSTDRFRVCANDGCRWVFEDTSRAGRRRWCDMSTCGNRAKVRRYRARRQPDVQVTTAEP
jgi:predicted RNA-binding Zn ribbon-like protein